MIPLLWRVRRKNEIGFNTRSNIPTIPVRKYCATSRGDLKSHLEVVAKQLNVQDMSDWYSKTKKVFTSLTIIIGTKDFVGTVDQDLFKKYHDSPYQLLSAAYPDYEWLPWKFNPSPKHFWSDVNNQMKFIKWLSNQLKLSSMDDWYNVTIKVYSLRVFC